MNATVQQVPHEYGPSTVGHGEAQCRWCLGTNRENAILDPNHCPERARRDPMYSRQTSDDALRSLWRSQGGEFHGPNIETGTMPESRLLPFLRALITNHQSGALTALQKVHSLATELCDAVDRAAEDIGGSRPTADILQQLGPACDAAEKLLNPPLGLPCPKCGGTAMEARASVSHGNKTLLTGYYWHCFNDGYTPKGVDCEFSGPEHLTSEQAVRAWNELPRAPAADAVTWLSPKQHPEDEQRVLVTHEDKDDGALTVSEAVWLKHYELFFDPALCRVTHDAGEGPYGEISNVKAWTPMLGPYRGQ